VSQTGIAVHSNRANRSALLLGGMNSHASTLNALIGHRSSAREPQSAHPSRPGRSTAGQEGLVHLHTHPQAGGAFMDPDRDLSLFAEQEWDFFNHWLCSSLQTSFLTRPRRRP